jgi:hypothetical protein
MMPYGSRGQQPFAGLHMVQHICAELSVGGSESDQELTLCPLGILELADDSVPIADCVNVCAAIECYSIGRTARAASQDNRRNLKNFPPLVLGRVVFSNFN